MKRTKNIITAAIALCLTLASSVNAAALEFTDSAGHWAEGSIDKWSDYGAIKGSDGLFRPDDTITRAEFFAILQQTLNITAAGGIVPVPEDLPADAWYTAPVLALVEAGIVEPFEGMVEPLRELTRQEEAFYLATALRLDASEGNTVFTDDGEIGDWCKGFVKSMYEAGYISGYDTDSGKEFRPSASITRAEAVAFLNSVIQILINQPGAYNEAVTGNLLVNCEDVIISGASVTGNLYLSGEATDIMLNNVNIMGKLVVLGQ